MDFEEVLIQRTSTRSYKNQTVEEEKIQAIIQNIITAPSAGNMQAYKIYIIEDKPTIEGIKDAAWSQDHVSQSNLVFVFSSTPEDSSKGNNGEKEATFFSIQDATIAASYCQLSATNNGLASVWIGAFDDNIIKNILKMEENEIPIAIIPIGYPNEIAFPTTRKPIGEIIQRIK